MYFVLEPQAKYRQARGQRYLDKNMEITNFPTVGPKRSEHCPGPSEGLKIWRQTRKEGLLKEKYFAPTYDTY